MGTPTEYVADQRIFIKDMPDDANMYIGWRNGLKAAILAVAKSGEIAEVSRFLIELDDTTGHQTPGLALPTNNALFGLDAKIYTALLNSLKGVNAEKYTFKITNTATFGCGRQAIRMLDISFAYDAEKVAIKSTSMVLSTRCKNMAGLDDCITSFRTHKLRMGNGAHAMSPVLGVQIMVRAVSHITECQATLALRQASTSPNDLDTLLASLEELFVQWKATHDAHAAGGAFAAKGGQGGGKDGGKGKKKKKEEAWKKA